MNLISNAYAHSSPADGGMSMLIMIGVFFIIMYFMIIRPQNKRAKEHKKLIASLKNNTEVVISNSMMGKIKKIYDDDIEIEIANNVIIKVKKNSVTTVLPKGTI